MGDQEVNRTSGRRVTRRKFLERSAELGFGLFAAGQIGGMTFGLAQPAQSGPQVRLTLFANVGGGNLSIVAKEVSAAYMKTHPGVTLDVLEGTTFEVYPKMLTARRLTPDRPLVHFGYMNPAFLYQGDKDDMWESLDPANIPNMQGISESYLRPQNRGVGFSSAPVVLAYNTRIVREPPTSWTDMWHPRFKRKVVIQGKYNWYLNGLVIAAKLNGGSERNPDPGFKLWSEHADQYVAFANSGAEQLDILVRGDAHLTTHFGGSVLTWKDAGAPVDYVMPREGAIAFPIYFIVTKGVSSAQKKIAEEVINLMLSERWLARWAVTSYYSPATKKSMVPPSFRNLPLFDPKEVGRAIQLDWATMAANETVWRERWDKEVVARIP